MCSPRRSSKRAKTVGTHCIRPTCATCCCAPSGSRGNWCRRAFRGSVISLTSIEGVRAAPGYAAYAAAKAGVINYTKTAALELAPHGIRVNAIAPDITLTEGLARLGGDAALTHMGNIVPLGRPGHVDEIASVAVFLASDMSAYLTGQTLHVDGGTHAAGGWYHDPQTQDYRLGPSAQ